MKKYIEKLEVKDTPRLINTVCKEAGIENVPLCASGETIKKIGDIVTADDSTSYKFYSVLYGKIAKQVILSFSHTNRFKEFKKGMMEVGDVIEFIKPKDFTGTALPAVDSRTGANVDAPSRHDDIAQYSAVNLKAYYKDTLDIDELKTAFTSLDNFANYYNAKVANMYTMYEYDEELTFIYLLGKIASGVTPVEMDYGSTRKEQIAKVKSIARKACNLPSKAYNPRGALWKSNMEDIIIFAEVDTLTDVEVNELAAAFQLDKMEIRSRIIDLNSFVLTDDEVARLKAIGVMDANETAPAVTDLKYLIVDKKGIQIYDKLLTAKVRENEEGLFYNNFLHWQASYAWVNWATFVALTVDSTEPTD